MYKNNIFEINFFFMSSSNRILSVDIFRGLTIAGMILVNTPGTWSHVYAPFLHADWHGLTPTDLIFPFFLFIVGMSITFAYTKKKIFIKV
jgi:predicted acyltransferase